MPTSYRAFAKLFIASEEGGSSFGQGVISLLKRVEENNSLNKAAKDMHMAYSKAWTLMNRAEKGLGVQLIERNGARGSTLTEEGRLLVRAYDTVQEELEEYANKRLREVLESIRPL